MQSPVFRPPGARQASASGPSRVCSAPSRAAPAASSSSIRAEIRTKRDVGMRTLVIPRVGAGIHEGGHAFCRQDSHSGVVAEDVSQALLTLLFDARRVEFAGEHHVAAGQQCLDALESLRRKHGC